MYGKKIIKKLRFLKTGGDIPKLNSIENPDSKNIANFDTLMNGASNLFVNFNNSNINNRRVSLNNPFDFMDNVDGADSFYTPFYQTNIDKEIEKRLNNNSKEEPIQEEEVMKDTEVIKDTKKEVKEKDPTAKYRYKEYNGKKSKEVFDNAMDRVAKYDKRLTQTVREFLTEIAARESGFKINANAVTNSHTGYFQMSDNNIKAYGNDVTKDQYIRDPELQITTALNLIDEFTRLMPSETLEKAKEKGYNKYGLLAGAWAGGNGGVNSFILKDEDRSDVHHYRKVGDTKSKGVSVGQYIKLFSNLFNNK